MFSTFFVHRCGQPVGGAAPPARDWCFILLPGASIRAATLDQ